MAHKHSIYDTDAHFKIDKATRNITDLSKVKATLVQGDHNSERYTFEIPRYVDGHDMSLCDLVEIHYVNTGSSTRSENRGVYIVDDLQVSPEDENNVVIFSWLISSNVTKNYGTLSFLIRFSCTEDGEDVYTWNTNINKDKTISMGMYNSDTILEENPDAIAQLLDDIRDKVAKRGHTPNKYLGTDDKGNVVTKDAPSGGGDAGSIGSLNDLMTSDKSSIVAAINELYNMLGGSFKLNSASKLSNGKFKLVSPTSNAGYNSTAEAAKNFDDSSWETISIPHDWSIHRSFNKSSQAGYQGGFLDGGDAWYRFKLHIKDLDGQRLYVYFDGIYMESDVYINGTKLKSNKWYNPFYVDITDYVKYDNEDVLSVFVRNRQPNSRWYSGSGFIRNAYLVSANDVEIGIHDVSITTPTLEEDIKSNTANTRIDARIKSKTATTITMLNEIYFNGSLVKSQTKEISLNSGTNNITENIVINEPKLWGVYEGNLYVLKTYLKKGSITYHTYETKYGYRYFKFDKDAGLWLNGTNLKLKGVCMHHDLGCIGAEINRSAIERQVDLLIKIGVNSIRLTHNPSSYEYLNVCAEKGMLAIEEFFDCWNYQKNAFDFHRFYDDYAKEVVDTTVNRGKNNPAIIMWSIGNEIAQVSQYTEEKASEMVKTLSGWIKAIDTERPVTQAVDTIANDEKDKMANAFCRELDVIGLNYSSTSEYQSFRDKNPTKCIYGSETTSAVSTRGIYTRNDADRHLSSFDDNKVDWGDYASNALKKHMHDIEYLAGMFVWTGFDYIGEPTPYNTFPSRSSNFGIYDICGFPKDIAYMYQSRWTEEPMVHILPHWDWESGNKKVWLYSNCHKVELFFNGTSLGEKLQTAIGDKYQFEYFVDYEKGTLVANGYDETGAVIAQDVVYTSLGTATTAKLSSDKTHVNVDSDDLVFITCDLVDSNGVIVPTANNSITFSVTGGTVLGTDNGDANCVEDCRTNVKSAFNGKVLCVVKHDGVSGSMTIKASGAGLLKEGTITVTKSKETVLTPESKKTFIDATKPPIYDYDEDPGLDNGIMYKLAEPTTFNGIDQSIDTGVKLFDVNKDFTIFVDFTSSANPQTPPDYDDRKPTPIVHCIKESNPWPGMDISIHTGKYSDNENGYDTARGQIKNEPGKLGYFANSLSLGIPYNSTDRHKIIIVKTAADKKVTVYDKLGKVGELSGNLIEEAHDTNVTLGVVVKTTGEKTRWWTGTIHNCSVWSRVLTQTEISGLFK